MSPELDPATVAAIPKTAGFRSWDERFGQIDRIVAKMPPVERTCATCRFADVPPMPSDPNAGWIGQCIVPIPVNALWINRPTKLEFAAADAARWEGKRLRPCPAWQAADAIERGEPFRP